MSALIETTDINFAAFLRVKHRLPILDMTKDQSGRVTWNFQLDEGTESELVSDFYTGSLVPAVQYAYELKSLKSALYNI